MTPTAIIRRDYREAKAKYDALGPRSIYRPALWTRMRDLKCQLLRLEKQAEMARRARKAA